MSENCTGLVCPYCKAQNVITVFRAMTGFLDFTTWVYQCKECKMLFTEYTSAEDLDGSSR